MQAIITKYLGPTNHRGARVKATCQARSLTTGWDHALNPDQNHAEAARALAAELEWWGSWVPGCLPNGTGYAFVILDGASHRDVTTSAIHVTPDQEGGAE